jgi:hypothetical protein
LPPLETLKPLYLFIYLTLSKTTAVQSAYDYDDIAPIVWRLQIYGLIHITVNHSIAE